MAIGQIVFSRNLRHHKFISSVVSVLPAGDVNLISQLGTSNILGFYDGRQGLISSGGNISSWQDVRGTIGFGPTLSVDGTAPSLGSSGKSVVFNAGGDLSSAALTAFAMTNPISVIFVGTITTNGANVAALAINSADAAGLEISPSSGFIGMFTDASTNTTVAISSTIVITIITGDGSQAATIQVPNKTAVSHTTTAVFDAGAAHLTLGGFFPGQGTNGGCEAYATLVLNRIATGTDITNITSWATTNLGAVAQ